MLIPGLLSKAPGRPVPIAFENISEIILNIVPANGEALSQGT
jgi:hypothetical protein